MRKLLAGVLVVLLLAVFGSTLILSRSDWNLARRWLAGEVSQAIGRNFSINGDLRLGWVSGKGWWLPRPRVTAEDVAVSNPDWAQRDELATVGKVVLVIDPLPLFRNTVLLPLIDISGARVVLERKADGRNNWTFAADAAKREGSSSWRLAFGSLRISSSRVSLVDEQQDIVIDSRIDTASRGLVWQLMGELAGAEVSGEGSAGSLLALGDRQTPYPVEARLRVGQTAIDMKGKITNPSDPVAVDVQLQVSGASMAHLYPLTRIVLPKTGSFATAGHLTGTLGQGAGKWRYENFTGNVGSSDIRGTLVYDAGVYPPRITGELVSEQLLFSDLAPLIGADSGESREQRGSVVEQPVDRVLPVEPFATNRWRDMNAAVSFTGLRIVHGDRLPLSDLYAEVVLEDSVLRLEPLRFGVAGGRLDMNIRMDGRKEPLQAGIKADAKGLRLRELLPAVESMQASVGSLYASAELSATGNSPAALLGSADGELKVLLDRGTVSKLLLEAAGLNLANLVITRLFGDRQVAINCIAGGFRVEDGMMRTREFLMDTADATIRIEGEVNLADERLGLTVRPESKGLRLLSLRAPLYVTGSFKEPEVGVDKSVLALRAGSAAALGAVAPLAALLPLIGVGTDQEDGENACIGLLREARQEPREPSPPSAGDKPAPPR